MVGHCDLYLWKVSEPNMVYLIDSTLPFKEAANIGEAWTHKNGDYALMNKGHIPWDDTNMPTIKRIDKSMVMTL